MKAILLLTFTCILLILIAAFFVLHKIDEERHKRSEALAEKEDEEFMEDFLKIRSQFRGLTKEQFDIIYEINRNEPEKTYQALNDELNRNMP